MTRGLAGATRVAVIAVTAAIGLVGIGAWWLSTHAPSQPGVDEAAKREVVRGYRRLAHYSYEAAYHSAGELKSHIAALLAAPSAETLEAAREAWRAARKDYSQTEVFRFGNWIVDDWEVSVNAWPVDEGLIDYVSADYAASPTNPLARHNLVASAVIEVGGVTLDTQRPGWTQLKFIHGSDVEANVVLGYHAIEFMLWGQDLHVAIDQAGQRPWTDYAADAQHCTSGPRHAPVLHCQRRRKILQVMAEHLYSQLGSMTLSWAGNSPTSYGLHIAEGDTDEGLRRMLYGMIRLAGDEMTGERMQVALFTGAPEEEQDCFSDDTHQSIYYNAVGIENIYYGRYQNDGYRDGVEYQAPLSLAELARRADPELAGQIDQAFARTRQAVSEIRRQGEAGHTFDLLIQPGNRLGEQALSDAMAALQSQSRLLETLGDGLGLNTLNPQAPDASPGVSLNPPADGVATLRGGCEPCS